MIQDLSKVGRWECDSKLRKGSRSLGNMKNAKKKRQVKVEGRHHQKIFFRRYHFHYSCAHAICVFEMMTHFNS